MKIPKLSAPQCAYFARIIVDEQDYESLPPSEKSLIEATVMMAENYMSHYTGLEIDSSGEFNYDYSTLEYCGKVLFAEAWDNRNFSWQYNQTNPMVNCVLGMYSTNSLPSAEEDE